MWRNTTTYVAVISSWVFCGQNPGNAIEIHLVLEI